MTILCIDDEPELLRLLKDFLQAHGHEVLTASDGRHGLEIICTNPVDVVVLDYLMPDMDGMAVAIEVRRIAPQTRIVVYSATPLRVPDRLMGLADKFVNKGDSPLQLVAAVDALAAVEPNPVILRAHPRSKVNFKAVLAVKRHDGPITAWVDVNDLSEGGLGGEVTRRLDLQELVSLDMVLPGASASLAIDARVRHRHAAFHGFQFVEPTAEQGAAIRQFCRTVPR